MVAQVIFFLFVGTLVLAILGIWGLWRKAKKMLSSRHDGFQTESTREGAVIDGRISGESKK